MNRETVLHAGRIIITAAVVLAAVSLVPSLSTVSSAASRRASSETLTIRNKNFDVIYVVNSRKDVVAFRSIWKAKKIFSSSTIIFHWQYKIDFPDGSRWLYDPKGYAQLVTTKTTPVYRISPVRKFNALLKVSAPPE